MAIGYATASVVDGEAHLDQLSVDPSHQGFGVGSALVEMVCAWAKAKALSAITSTTFVDVPWNGPFYQRRGFIALDPGEEGAELRAIRQNEIDSGLDIAARWAMRRMLC